MLHVANKLTCNLLAVIASPLPAPGVPANSLSRRVILPCPEEDCGPFPVQPIPPPSPAAELSDSRDAVPENSLQARDALLCPLGEGCGPIVVYPPQKRSAPSVDCALVEGCGPIVVPPNSPPSGSESTVSLRSPAVCTEWVGPLPIGSECFTSGPYAGQCIPFYCLQRPDTCGCPGAPPPAAQT